METQVLIYEDKFQVGHQFLQDVEDIDHFQILVYDIIDVAWKIGREQVIQRFGYHLDMNERARLFSISLNGDKAIKIRLKNELVDHSVKSHALAVAIYV